jgi:hypothetical protein
MSALGGKADVNGELPRRLLLTRLGYRTHRGRSVCNRSVEETADIARIGSRHRSMVDEQVSKTLKLTLSFGRMCWQCPPKPPAVGNGLGSEAGVRHQKLARAPPYFDWARAISSTWWGDPRIDALPAPQVVVRTAPTGTPVGISVDAWASGLLLTEVNVAIPGARGLSLISAKACGEALIHSLCLTRATAQPEKCACS